MVRQPCMDTHTHTPCTCTYGQIRPIPGVPRSTRPPTATTCGAGRKVRILQSGVGAVNTTITRGVHESVAQQTQLLELLIHSTHIRCVQTVLVISIGHAVHMGVLLPLSVAIRLCHKKKYCHFSSAHAVDLCVCVYVCACLYIVMCIFIHILYINR